MTFTTLPSAGATPILIIALPVRLRASLAAVLKPSRPVQLVDPAVGGVAMLQVLLEHDPCFVLIDAALPAQASWRLLSWIKQTWPQAACLVLVEDHQQEQTALQRGADRVLRKGFALAELLAIITASTCAAEPALCGHCTEQKGQTDCHPPRIQP